MNRALVWIGAVVLAVGPSAMLGRMRPAATRADAKPVSAYVLMDGPVAASTDDVVVAVADEGGMEVGNGGGSMVTSLAWTGAVGVLVLAAWGAVVAGEAVMTRSRQEAHGRGGMRRAVRRGWRFAVPGAARWGSVARLNEATGATNLGSVGPRLKG